ncbi:hypothetical protein MNB_SV-12-1246 [hydrothermal vent metagenome]|uniref:Uncharacterized protein n=1 Tax=hydrothermal vent metagenome TaxID=652676 RepID=A0A1W1C2F7_9ZZZZ
MKNISKNLLFFRTDKRKSFDSYQLIENFPLSKTDIVIYDISKKVKEIDPKGKIALQSLQALLNKKVTKQDEIRAYRNLDTFLVSTPAFRKNIRGMKATEIADLKRTVINSMFEKIYDNITKDRGVSNLRFALVLLKEELNKFDNTLVSHIFYDIQNGININREIEKIFVKQVKESIDQKKLVIEIDSPKSNLIELFIKQDTQRRFIDLLLNTLLSMHSYSNCDSKKIAILVSYMCYIAYTEDIKTTKKNGKTKIQIAHSFMILVEYQAKHNSSNFILLLKKFLKKRNRENIEEFLKKICLGENIPTIKEGTLRQKNLKFLNNMIIIGQFYRAISEEQDMELVIDTLQKKILDNSVNIEKMYQKEEINNFLKLFSKKYRKKESKQRLNDFFKAFRNAK